MFCCPSILLPASSPMTTWDPFVPNTYPTIPTPALLDQVRQNGRHWHWHLTQDYRSTAPSNSSVSKSNGIGPTGLCTPTQQPGHLLHWLPPLFQPQCCLLRKRLHFCQRPKHLLHWLPYCRQLLRNYDYFSSQQRDFPKAIALLEATVLA